MYVSYIFYTFYSWFIHVCLAIMCNFLCSHFISIHCDFVSFISFMLRVTLILLIPSTWGQGFIFIPFVSKLNFVLHFILDYCIMWQKLRNHRFLDLTHSVYHLNINTCILSFVLLHIFKLLFYAHHVQYFFFFSIIHVHVQHFFASTSSLNALTMQRPMCSVLL